MESGSQMVRAYARARAACRLYHEVSGAVFLPSKNDDD